MDSWIKTDTTIELKNGDVRFFLSDFFPKTYGKEINESAMMDAIFFLYKKGLNPIVIHDFIALLEKEKCIVLYNIIF